MSAEWLSVEGAAASLGIGSRTVYGLINRGELTAYRMGRVYRIKATDIDIYLDSARVKPGELEHLTPKPYDGPRAIDLRAVEAS